MITIPAEPGRSVEIIRAALEEHDWGPRGSGLQFRSRCGVHGSRGLTLAVSQGRVGALVTCYAGCETTEILAALGLTWDALFDQPRERTPDWRPRPRVPEPTPAEQAGKVIVRALEIVMLREAMEAYRERCPMPEVPWEERVELAEWASQRDADAHYWRVWARWSALACDREYVRAAYAQRDKWLASGNWRDAPTHEQAVVLNIRAEDLQRQAAAEAAA